MEKLKRGISLIVLVITIIVMIILAASIILALTSTNTIGKATEATFKNTSKSYLEEYNAWLSDQKLNTNGTFDISEVNASKNVAYNGNYIQDIIKNIKNEDIENYEIIAGNLVYTGAGQKDNIKLENEIKWAKEAGLKSIEKAKGEEDTIVFTDTKVDSGYDELKVYGSSENGVAGLSEISLTVTQNLIDNGFGEYKDGTNFSSYFTNLPNEKVKGGVSCFYIDRLGDSINTSREKIPVDVNKEYKLSMYIKPNLVGTRTYSGLIEYDADGNIIQAHHILSIEDTLTYLTEDLKNGDTVVHLNDVSKFEDTTATYRLGFIFWNYRDSTGRLYEPLTYSRNVWSNLYTADNIDRENNTITLNKSWSNGTIKEGTKVCQSNSGSQYNYGLYPADTTTTEWNRRGVAISGTKINNTQDMKRFRYSTKSVTWHIIPNYNSVEGGGAKVANIIIAESDKYNQVYTIDMTGHEPLRTMEDGTSDYIDFKTKKIVRNVGVNNGTMYKLSSVVYEDISLPDIPIYEGNTAITLNQTGRLEGTYIK